jgi:hypothetical protein
MFCSSSLRQLSFVARRVPWPVKRRRSPENRDAQDTRETAIRQGKPQRLRWLLKPTGAIRKITRGGVAKMGMRVLEPSDARKPAMIGAVNVSTVSPSRQSCASGKAPYRTIPAG